MLFTSPVMHPADNAEDALNALAAFTPDYRALRYLPLNMATTERIITWH